MSWVHGCAGLTAPRQIAEFMRESRVSRLMVAGNRESRDPGIGDRAEWFLIVAFKSLTGRPAS
jgi:hypothetical protein